MCVHTKITSLPVFTKNTIRTHSALIRIPVSIFWMFSKEFNFLNRVSMSTVYTVLATKSEFTRTRIALDVDARLTAATPTREAAMAAFAKSWRRD